MDKVSLSEFRDARKHRQELYEQYKKAAKPYEDICYFTFTKKFIYIINK